MLTYKVPEQFYRSAGAAVVALRDGVITGVIYCKQADDPPPDVEPRYFQPTAHKLAALARLGELAWGMMSCTEFCVDDRYAPGRRLMLNRHAGKCYVCGPPDGTRKCAACRALEKRQIRRLRRHWSAVEAARAAGQELEKP
jgi:hypothetical protein